MLLGWLFATCFAVVLELLVIYYLARGPWKQFPFVLALCAVQVLVASADTFVSTLTGIRSSIYLDVYWSGDMLAHGAILLLTNSLIWQSLEHRDARRRNTIIALLSLAVLCFALFSAYILDDRH